MAERDDQPAPVGIDSDFPDTVAGSIGEEVRALGTSARQRAETEWAYQTARAAVAGRYLGWAVGLGCLAASVLFFALMALVVGAVIGLAKLVGIWAASGIVFAALVALSALAATAALRRARRITALFGPES